MNGQHNDPFARLVTALEPWLDQVVIVGGWAHKLYRLHPDAQRLEYPPLSTLDTDVALPAKLPAREANIRERLVAYGFGEELFGDDQPPATHYHLNGEASGFYVEFLTPLIGSEYDRKRKRKATIAIAGIASQQLRYIELLLHHPWSIHFESLSDGVVAQIQVANPVSFIAQKILIHAEREREDRAKDILYMRDTLELFGARFPELQNLWRSVVAPQLHRRGTKTVVKAPETLFGELTDDIRRAAEISPERALAPDEIRQACGNGLSQVFIHL